MARCRHGTLGTATLVEGAAMASPGEARFGAGLSAEWNRDGGQTHLHPVLASNKSAQQENQSEEKYQRKPVMKHWNHLSLPLQMAPGSTSRALNPSNGLDSCQSGATPLLLSFQELFPQNCSPSTGIQEAGET